jgi:hypothetical protein
MIPASPFPFQAQGDAFEFLVDAEDEVGSLFFGHRQGKVPRLD